MPNLAYALVDSTFEPFRAGELVVKPASEPWEKQAYYGLRRAVFSDEQQLLPQDKDGAVVTPDERIVHAFTDRDAAKALAT